MLLNQIRLSGNKLKLINLIASNSSITPLRMYTGAGAETKTNSTRDKPVKFSTSKAKAWDPVDTFISARARKQPISQPFIVIGSILMFLLYFTYIREPNEMDEIFDRPLEATIPNVKEMTLKYQIAQYEQMGLDTTSLKQALEREIKNKKNKA
jgi:hypothetical protein